MKHLNRLYWLKQEIKQIENQIKELTVLSATTMSGIKQIENQIKELTVLSATAMSGMPSGKKVSSPVERFLLRMEELTEKLAQKYEELSAETERIVEGLTEKLAQKYKELSAETERIEEYIESIEDVEVRLIARKRFIEHKNFQTIGDEMYIDRTTAAKKLKRYLEGGGNVRKET